MTERKSTITPEQRLGLSLRTCAVTIEGLRNRHGASSELVAVNEDPRLFYTDGYGIVKVRELTLEPGKITLQSQQGAKGHQHSLITLPYTVDEFTKRVTCHEPGQLVCNNGAIQTLKPEDIEDKIALIECCSAILDVFLNPPMGNGISEG